MCAISTGIQDIMCTYLAPSAKGAPRDGLDSTRNMEAAYQDYFIFGVITWNFKSPEEGKAANSRRVKSHLIEEGAAQSRSPKGVIYN